MSDLGDVGKCVATTQYAPIHFTGNIFHRNNQDAPLTIHISSSQTSGVALMVQGTALVALSGISSSGDIYFYDLDIGVYYVTTSTGGGEDWAVTITEPTTTASFTVAALASTQSVSVSSATGLSVNQYIQITDSTHTINGQITAIAGTTLTVSTLSLIGGTHSGDTMASGALVSYAVSVQQLHAANRASAYAFS